MNDGDTAVPQSPPTVNATSAIDVAASGLMRAANYVEAVAIHTKTSTVPKQAIRFELHIFEHLLFKLNIKY